MNNLIPPTGILRLWADLYGPHTEAPEEAHLGAAIALISAAIGWKCYIRWGRNTEPSTINVVLEGGSAVAKKTTVANTAHGLARAACGHEADEWRQLYTHTVGHTSDAGLIDLVSPEDEKQAEIYENRPPPGHLIVWDEFGNVLGDPGMIRKGGDWLGRVRTTIMGLTNGRHSGSTTRMSKKTGSRCAVSILATMTRVELEERVDTGLLRDGFLGRFALIPLSSEPPVIAIPPRWEQGDRDREQVLVDWLRELAGKTTEYGEAFDLMMPDAKHLRTTWYTTRMAELRGTAKDDPSEVNIARYEAFSRLQTLAVKVAVVSMISKLDHPATDATIITIDDVQYGQDIADYCLNEITALATESEESHPADEWARRFLSWLGSQPGANASKREVDRALQSRRLSPAQRWAIVEHLHANGDVLITKAKAKNGRDQLRVSLSDMSDTPLEQSTNGHKLNAEVAV